MTTCCHPAGHPAVPGADPLSAADWTAWSAAVGPAIVAGAAVFHLTGSDLPWSRRVLTVDAGQQVTVLLAGRWYFSRPHDLWVEPGVAFHARVGGGGPVFNPMANTGTLVAARSGALEIARSAGEWADDAGRLHTPMEAYVQADGRIDGVAIAWRGDALEGLRALRAAMGGARKGAGDAAALVDAEIARLQAGPAAPAGWRHFHMFGDGGIFTAPADGEICCHTHKNVGILQKDVAAPLDADAALSWRWIVDDVPAPVAEDQLPTHDYLSIAVEFDDGQDITYMWSSSLEVGTVFRCPLPYWCERETHVVVRSGTADLHRWLAETRRLHDDYHRHIGGAATRIVRVWLIANSVFLRRTGACRYADIVLQGAGWREQVL